MPPIPIYTKSPISAAKASGVTPETEAPGSQGQQAARPPATTTEQGSRGYRAPRPGAVPSLPEPTGSSPRTRYATLQPTPTTQTDSQGPFPPQPGAAPVPPGARVTLPPPPKAGEKYQAPEPSQPPQPAGVPYPPQMAVPSPAVLYGQRGTSTSTAPGSSPPPLFGQSSAPAGGQVGYSEATSHPIGYRQNANAPAFAGYQQRAAHDAQFAEDGNNSYEGNDEGVWSSAKKWAQAAGERLSEAESEVWRRINKE